MNCAMHDILIDMVLRNNIIHRCGKGLKRNNVSWDTFDKPDFPIKKKMLRFAME